MGTNELRKKRVRMARGDEAMRENFTSQFCNVPNKFVLNNDIRLNKNPDRGVLSCVF